MLVRCLKPTSTCYHKYGARGITVCDRWLKDFSAFFNDMGPKPTPEHTLDRKDNNGNYEPHNCRWATLVEQANNKRNNRRVIYRGQEMTLPDAVRAAGNIVSNGTAQCRIVTSQWTVETAVETPPKFRREPGTRKIIREAAA